MKGCCLYTLSALLVVNIAVCGYLVYLIGDFHRDTRHLKQTLSDTAHVIHDTWALTAGSIPDKARVIGKRLPNKEQVHTWFENKSKWIKRATAWVHAPGPEDGPTNDPHT